QETMQRYQTALQGDNLRYEISFQQKDGSTNWHDVMVFRVMEKDDRLLGFIIATDDITHRKTAELEKDRLTTDLMTRNKDLTQFSMIISHNLRAPVATIMGLATLLERKDTLSAGDLDRCLTGIVSAARNIDHLIRALTDILQRKRALSDGKELVWFSSLLDELRETLKA